MNSNTNVKIYTLFSGSSGNCSYFKCGDAEFLIDAGGSMKTINTALEKVGSSLSKINAIFITHEHSDHIKGCAVISKHYSIPIHVESTISECLGICGNKNIVVHNGLFSEKIGKATISSFKTSHDSISSCGYTVSCGGEVYGIATDTGYVNSDILSHLTYAKALIIEANYDIDMLKYGPYPYDLKVRIASKKGHLSNEESARLCSYLARNGTENILLAHISDKNNTPERALSAVRAQMKADGTRADVRAADRYLPTLLYASAE